MATTRHLLPGRSSLDVISLLADERQRYAMFLRHAPASAASVHFRLTAEFVTCFHQSSPSRLKPLHWSWRCLIASSWHPGQASGQVDAGRAE